MGFSSKSSSFAFSSFFDIFGFAAVLVFFRVSGFSAGTFLAGLAFGAAAFDAAAFLAGLAFGAATFDAATFFAGLAFGAATFYAATFFAGLAFGAVFFNGTVLDGTTGSGVTGEAGGIGCPLILAK